MGSNRAGRKKHRNGSGKTHSLNPAPPERGHTLLEDDRLRMEQSARLEALALERGWVLGGNDPAQQKVREALMARVANIGLKTPDERVAVAALRAVSTAELRQQAVRLRAIPRDLPAPVQVGVQVNIEEPKPHEMVRRLLDSREVQQALIGNMPAPE